MCVICVELACDQKCQFVCQLQNGGRRFLPKWKGSTWSTFPEWTCIGSALHCFNYIHILLQLCFGGVHISLDSAFFFYWESEMPILYLHNQVQTSLHVPTVWIGRWWWRHDPFPGIVMTSLKRQAHLHKEISHHRFCGTHSDFILPFRSQQQFP